MRDLPNVAFLNGVTDLQQIERQGGMLHVGAGVTIATLRTAVAQTLPSLGELLRRYASEQVRNAATIGGNLLADLAYAWVDPRVSLADATP